MTLGVRPEHIAHGNAAPAQPFSQEIEIEIVEPMGSDTLVWTKLGGQNFSFRVDAEQPLHRRRAQFRSASTRRAPRCSTAPAVNGSSQ